MYNINNDTTTKEKFRVKNQAKSKMSTQAHPQIKLAILISGGGSNLLAILLALKKFNAEKNNSEPSINVEIVIADRQARGLDFAREFSIATLLIEKTRGGHHFEHINTECKRAQADYIILAGFLGIVPARFTRTWKIINIHPSLLPKFGGRGMYGIRVHEAVLEAKEERTGCTVHYVTEGIDEGKIIAQDSLEVLKNDNAESLQKRVLELEHRLYPKTIISLCLEYYKEKF